MLSLIFSLLKQRVNVAFIRVKGPQRIQVQRHRSHHAWHLLINIYYSRDSFQENKSEQPLPFVHLVLAVSSHKVEHFPDRFNHVIRIPNYCLTVLVGERLWFVSEHFYVFYVFQIVQIKTCLVRSVGVFVVSNGREILLEYPERTQIFSQNLL